MGDRRRAERQGHRAEILAMAALMLKGYRLLARRFRTPLGEVDLIMRRGCVTAFIEVKNRFSGEAAIAALSARQRRRIVAAARLWMSRDPKCLKGDCRFDIVTVAPYHWPRHLPNAFIAED